MPATPNTTSDEYDANIEAVLKVRAFVSGNVKPYVRRLDGHITDDVAYEKYCEWAGYTNFVSLTLQAFTGMIMSPEPVISDAPDALEEYLDDLTSDGEPFQRVCYRTVEEVAATGRCFVLVDYPDVPGAADLSRLEAERANLRPFVRSYPWEALIALKTELRGGVRVLSHVRLRETVSEPGENEWADAKIEQVRVLDLKDGAYRVRVFRKTQGQGSAVPADEWEQFGSDRFPKMAGRAMDFIPGVVIGAGSLDPTILTKPPVLDLVNTAENHLNVSALEYNALRWLGSPSLVISGLIDSGDEDPTPIRMGSSQAIVLGEGGAAEIISLKGGDIGALSEKLDSLRLEAAALGARIFGDESAAQISTETARIQRAGEHSVLAGIANTVADGMTQVLRWVGEWAGIAGADKIAVTLNTDFLPKGLQPGELAEWLAALQAGTMPLPVVLEHLKSRGVIDPQMTEAEWNDGIDEGLVDRPEPAVGDGEDEEIEEAA